MKTIEYAYCYGISLQSARHLTDEEKTHYKPECRDSILIGVGDHIALPYITGRDLNDLTGRETYSFRGCGNRAYELTDAEWDAFVALNAARAAEAEAKEDRERIEAAEAVIAKAEAQRDIPTAEEAARRIRQYNNIYNEGGEGYVPQIITVEQYERAKAVLARKKKEA